MNAIPLDNKLRARLYGLNEPVTVLDESGKAVGVFLPMNCYEALLRIIPIPYSEEEIERRRNEKGGCSLQELWEKLKKRLDITMPQ